MSIATSARATPKLVDATASRVPDLPVVSFLSDYGLDDEFVGVCKGVLLSLAPHVSVIDITHNVPPHDVRAGALALVRAVQYLPTGVVLAVVDPGVGTDRRTVAVEATSGPSRIVLVAAARPASRVQTSHGPRLSRSGQR